MNRILFLYQLLKSIFVLLGFTFFLGFSAEAKNYKLPNLNINADKITISGVSSGAFMAVQMHVAYSQVFSGVASIAGGIYWCSEGQSPLAISKCMQHPEQIKSEMHLAHALAEQNLATINPLTHLRKSRIYLFSSPDDFVVKQPSSKKLLEFYTALTEKQNIVYRNDFKSAHGWPTQNYGNDCATTGIPWLQNCKLDLAGELLNHLYPGLIKPQNEMPAHLYSFDQSEFGNQSTPLFTSGWVYIPEACSKGQSCALHLALHGCKMNPEYVQDQFAVNSGLNAWAEVNKIVILYPQAEKSAPNNPLACWDWYGFTGPDFANKKGLQMQALKKMVDRLAGKDFNLRSRRKKIH